MPTSQPIFPARPRRRPARWKRWLAWGLAALLILLNALAYAHARGATHFAVGGQPLDRFLTLPRTQQLQIALTGVQIPRPENRQTPSDHYLPYDVRRIELPHDEWLEAWFVPHPQSRGVLLMFGGYAGVKDGLLTPAATVFQLGYSSLLVDFRGSGGSSGSDTTLGLREADDVAAAASYARANWPDQPIILYGVSMGSAAILRAVAVDHVQPDGLILEGAFDNLLTTVRHRFDAVGVPSFPAAELLVFWGSVQMGYNGFGHNPSGYASAVHCPTLLMTGARDGWVRPAETRAIYDRLGGPKQLVEVPDVAHDMPFVYWAPELWRQSVAALLEQVPAAGQ